MCVWWWDILTALVTDMLRFLSDPIHGTRLAAAIVVAGVALSICLHDFGVLSRLGNAVLCISIIMLSRPQVTGTKIAVEVIDERTESNVNGPEYYRVNNLAEPEWLRNSEINKLAVNRRSPILAIVGTLIAGYGECLNIVFQWR